MAIVKLKDVPVTYVNGRGFGVKVTETSESRGKAFKQQYTLWFDEPHGLTVGDVVSVSGFLSAKVGTWQDREGNDRNSVELSVNKPELTEHEPVGTAEPDSWSEPPQGFNTEVPF